MMILVWIREKRGGSLWVERGRTVIRETVRVSIHLDEAGSSHAGRKKEKEYGNVCGGGCASDSEFYSSN